jgi:hypothetical protein
MDARKAFDLMGRKYLREILLAQTGAALPTFDNEVDMLRETLAGHLGHANWDQWWDPDLDIMYPEPATD